MYKILFSNNAEMDLDDILSYYTDINENISRNFIDCL
jgi:plasmid stabilization system protein ParE